MRLFRVLLACGFAAFAQTPPPASSDPILDAARHASATFTAELPNFLVQQVVTRQTSSSNPAKWQVLDIVTAEVACINGKEDYRNIAVNGTPIHGPVQNTGTWSTGEFVVTLKDVLSPATAATFVKKPDGAVGSRPAFLYELNVAQGNSHWVIADPGKREYRPGYRGTLWIDKETRRVLRIEQETLPAPPEIPYDARSIVEYGFVNIEDKRYLLPVLSENVACLKRTSNCVRNVIDFRNYRKFTASSDIKFEK